MSRVDLEKEMHYILEYLSFLEPYFIYKKEKHNKIPIHASHIRRVLRQRLTILIDLVKM